MKLANMQSGQGKCVGYVNLAISLFSCSLAHSRPTTRCYFLHYVQLCICCCYCLYLCFCVDCCCTYACMLQQLLPVLSAYHLPYVNLLLRRVRSGALVFDGSARCSNVKRKAKRGAPQMAKYSLLLCRFCT